jgi:hypothetical protein
MQLPYAYKTRQLLHGEGGFFRLRNVTIVGFYYLFLLNCYMFRSYDHPNVEIHVYLLEADRSGRAV